MNGLEIDTMYGWILAGGNYERRQAEQTGFSHGEIVRYP
jgi:hypothetical protein